MLDYLLKNEKNQFPCWFPVLLAIGILIRFNHEFVNFWLLGFIIIVCLCLIYFCSSNFLKTVLWIIFSILLGILALDIRIKTVDSPIIPFNEKFAEVTGIINNIVPLDHGYRVLLSDLKIKKLKKSQTPEKIRLTVRTKLNNAKIGNVIKVNAILNQPMQPYLPDSYDFARDAYFKRIGAVGYSVSDFTVVEENNKSAIGKINALRNKIQTRVNTAIGNYDGSIATALMINEYSNIDKQVLKNLRATGLAHILSVSGMHLSLVAAIFFITTRFIINCFETVALRVNSKKIASIISLFGSLAYLLVSGMEVAAVRSFIMTGMILIAIIIDRISSPMRAIAVAATIILLISPENIIHPSFQMSFAAVLALIACYELFLKINFDFSEFNSIQKFLFYLLSVSFSSLVAGLATAPFALYHFSQSSNYSILANLLAVPITTFWLMPCVVLTFLLYPFHLEIVSLYPMQMGINLLLRISDYIANLPYAVSHFAKITDVNLLIIVFGMLWFCILRSNIRFIGFLLIFIAIILQSFVKKPDIFVDWDKKTFAILDNENRLIFLTKPLVKFKKQLLMNQLGTTRVLKYSAGISKELVCENNICIFDKGEYQAKFDINNFNIEIYKDKVLQNNLQKSAGAELIQIQ